jgi:NADH-quinone oxidoreductase subunit G
MATATEVQLLNVQIDGIWMQFPKGTRVIEACRQARKSIPHYCYHPKLSSPGNCRMCLVEMGMPKMTPIASRCSAPTASRRSLDSTPADLLRAGYREGMAVRTDSPMVQECRKG